LEQVAEVDPEEAARLVDTLARALEGLNMTLSSHTV
jgi:hypothetical protein